MSCEGLAQSKPANLLTLKGRTHAEPHADACMHVIQVKLASRTMWPRLTGQGAHRYNEDIIGHFKRATLDVTPSEGLDISAGSHARDGVYVYALRLIVLALQQHTVRMQQQSCGMG